MLRPPADDLAAVLAQVFPPAPLQVKLWLHVSQPSQFKAQRVLAPVIASCFTPLYCSAFSAGATGLPHCPRARPELHQHFQVLTSVWTENSRFVSTLLAPSSLPRSILGSPVHLGLHWWSQHFCMCLPNATLVCSTELQLSHSETSQCKESVAGWKNSFISGTTNTLPPRRLVLKQCQVFLEHLMALWSFYFLLALTGMYVFLIYWYCNILA